MTARITRYAGVGAGVSVVLATSAMAGPGPIRRPVVPVKTTPAPIHVVVPTAASLPGARYVWVQPVFVRTSEGAVVVRRMTA